MKNKQLRKSFARLVFMAVLFFSVQSIRAENKAGLFPVIEPSRGISGAALGMSIKKALPLFGSLKPVASGVDDQYEGQIVYYYFFLNKDKDNNYGLEIYTDKKKKIFMFVINSPSFMTKEGIKVGSAEAELVKAFGKQLKRKKQGDIYIKYSLGGKKGTDFYVKDGVVTQIIVRDY